MVLLFKISVIIKVLLYMFLSIFVYFWRDFTKKEPANPMGPFTPVHWARACIRYAGASLKIHNNSVLESLNWERNVFFVSNHQSYYDIPSVIAGAGRIIGFIAKYELTRNPLLNYWMKKTGCVAINRKEVTSAIRRLAKLEKAGRPSHLVIFPEGTRSKTGSPGRIKPGGLKIAWQLKAVLVPVHIKGTRNIWETRPKRSVKGEVEVSFAEPVDLAQESHDMKFSEFFKKFEQQFQWVNEKK